MPEHDIAVPPTITSWRSLLSNTMAISLVGGFLYWGTTFVWDASQRNSGIDNQIAIVKMEADTTSSEVQQLEKNEDGIQVSLIQIQTTLATLAQETADDRAEHGHGPQ